VSAVGLTLDPVEAPESLAVESEMRSIGEMARASGLTVSALRFYDQAGVLVPAFVDPETGYRWYGEDQVRPARIVACLRRVGMPLPDIAAVLAQRDDREAVRRLLDAHLRRLEDGLADARRELSRVHALVDTEENSMSARTTPTRVTLAVAELAAALDAVRFAVGTDPELPVLGGVLLDVEDAALRLVATDRYRLAVAEAPAADVAGPAARVVAPAALLDEARAAMDDSGSEVTLVLDGAQIELRGDGWQVGGRGLDHEFPDYRRLLRGRGAHRVTVDVAAFRHTVATGPTRSVVRAQDGEKCEVTVLTLDADGRLDVTPGGAGGAPERVRVGVDREFLLEALAAGGSGQLVLELDGPITPLAVRVPDDDRTFSILMPTRVDD
jgi:DNA-binding transcriptional MerR regulator